MENKEKPKYQAIGLAGKTSYTFIIPKDFSTGIGLEKGDYVKVTREQDRLIVERAD
jgi:bifunctional DNA-binding transcriptional regulator/antitoxin component of YhaV-PrlF toxin-antitoxin module